MSIEHIVRVWDGATQAEREHGMRWYAEANAFACELATAYGVQLDAAAGVIAALSPNASWDSNREMARSVLQGKRKRLQAYPMNVDKAARIIDGAAPLDVLQGPKVRAFYRLIRDGGNLVDVCVDGHAASIAEGKDSPVSGRKLTPRAFDRYAQEYRDGAALLGVAPHVLQAVAWLAWRKGARVGQGRIEWN